MPVAGLVVLAGIGGAWVGSHQQAAPAATIAAARGPVGAIAPVATKIVQHPEQLLRDDSLLSHTFTPALLGRAAIVVDASSGRILWQMHAHQRRQVASTTKIMTALLALRKLGPHDIVTVDRSVPRVPLVREGLRAGEKVQAWKLFYGLLLFSGNDDALALAIGAAGSRPAFVHAM